jgi:hypothetical protein
MSENKYHISKNGFMTKCTATKRACSRGGGGHYTQEQYNELAAKNDPAIRKSASKPKAEGYLGKAEVAYVESVQRLKRFDKANAAANLYEKKLLKENNLETSYSFKTQEQVRATLEEALLYAKEVYVEEGVSYSKASFIIQDMKANIADPTKPITKRKDRMDEQIAAKTKNAKERLNDDPKYAELTKAHQEAVRKDHLAADVSRKVAQYRSNLIRDTNASGMNNIGEQEALSKAKTWAKAKIAPSAKEAPTSRVTPDDVSIDDKGKINNVWVETANGIEKVVSYREPNHPRNSGALVTENGTEVSTYTHYHSYKAEVGGIRNVIISDKNGPSYPAEKFSLSMSWDSGD